MLGFDHAVRTGASSYYYYYYYYYYRPRQIWLDDVQCTGNESSIEQCSFPGWGIENCYYWDDVSVACDCECVCLVVCKYTASNFVLDFEQIPRVCGLIGRKIPCVIQPHHQYDLLINQSSLYTGSVASAWFY